MDRMNRIKGYFEFGDNSHLDYSARRKFYDGEYVIVQDSETGEEKKVRDGWGIYDDGVEKYEGEFADDLYNGKGKIEFASGAIYEGDFYDNKFHYRDAEIFTTEPLSEHVAVVRIIPT